MLTIGMYYDVIPDKAKLFEDKFNQVLNLLQGVKGHKQTFLYRRVDDRRRAMLCPLSLGRLRFAICTPPSAWISRCSGRTP